MRRQFSLAGSTRRLVNIDRLTLLAVAALMAFGCNTGAVRERPERELGPAPFVHQDSIHCAYQGAAIEREAIRNQFLADCNRRMQVVQTLAPAANHLVTMALSIPEFHDEQRLLNDAADGFGPMVNLFASPFIGQFNYVWQVREQGRRGMLAALAFVDTTSGSALPNQYTELGLLPGTNCIWLAYRSITAQREWYAYVSQPRTPTAPCHQNDPRRLLAVVSARASGYSSHGDYPPVARFSEAVSGQTLLGVRCLNAWCEIGPAGADSNATFSIRPSSATGSDRASRIKGWHDEQLLARVDGGALKPTTVRAAVVPQPGMGELSAQDFEAEWVHAADIIIAGSLAGTKYDTWGLRSGRNLFWLWKDGSRWRARVTNPSGGNAKEWRNVGRELHFDAAVPHTARWRFTSYDDAIWVPCGQACCRADDVQTSDD
ncbi:MAG TPA: hypothetical protein VMM18_02935 [Gemmatimonadaceae bacterium]|nr:hypothetical protein [Gemmatimonadaceae bacterium]